MKKSFSLHTIGQMVVFFEMVLCIVASLCVLIVNGTGSFGADHFSLLMLIGITITSKVLLKVRKPVHYRTVLWMAILPMIFIAYEVIASLLPYQQA